MQRLSHFTILVLFIFFTIFHIHPLPISSEQTSEPTYLHPPSHPSFKSSRCASNPSHYDFTLGDIHATVVSDGQLQFQLSDLWRINNIALKRSYESNFLSTNPLFIDTNSLVLATPTKHILFDTGSGIFFQPNNTGRLEKNLKTAGISLSSIDTIFLTHGHPDHLGGLIDKNNQLVFPNAKIYISQKEYQFWTNRNVDLSGSAFPNPLKQILIKVAKTVLGTVKDHLRFIAEDGKTPFPEIRAINLPGHSPGHLGFMIKSGAQSLFFTGDSIINKPTSVNNPEWPTKVASNATKEVESRYMILDTLAKLKVLTLQLHGPWPGLGYVIPFRDAFDWVSAPGVFDMGVRKICGCTT